ncbi:unnamed protein product [Cylicocyclus nassatus]|uniref:Uncharacterized protein n=1 Tax=Cylicocyclus nassatus TaxID=53992 RepID=A0AA36DL24_CYLNA|nr:unnamed protein product [Cylicocyclus nassatus]
MLEVLILLLNLLGWICFMSLCARHNELKSEGRGMPRGASTHDSNVKSSESGSSPASYANENQQHHFKKTLTWQKKRFGRDDPEKKVDERKSSDEKTEPKSSRREKKEEKEKDAIKAVNKVTKEKIKTGKFGKANKAKESAVKTDHTIEKTQMVELKSTTSGRVDEAKTQMELARPSSSRSTDINKDVAVPGETLALLAAAEQMADDKGDYDNFGPPEAKLEK